jgi:hypothetical protein
VGIWQVRKWAWESPFLCINDLLVNKKVMEPPKGQSDMLALKNINKCLDEKAKE